MAFAFANHPIPARYRRSRSASLDPQMRRALLLASVPAALLLLLVLFLPAAPPQSKRVEELPERLARLILEEPSPPAVAPRSAPKSQVEPPPEVPVPEEKPAPKPVPVRRQTRRQTEPRVTQDQGQAGRERAKAEVAQQLTQVRQELDETLESLGSTLAETSSASPTSEAPSRRRGRGVRRGRSSAGTVASREVNSANVGSGSVLSLESVDLGAVAGSGENWTPPPSGGVESGGGGNGELTRSQASLLAVVRRYAPGIRYCYDNALKTDPSLRGKMIFSLTIALDGRVSAVEVIQDDLKRSDVRECALAQIRSWRFAAASGSTVFETPFVFRPPRP